MSYRFRHLPYKQSGVLPSFKEFKVKSDTCFLELRIQEADEKAQGYITVGETVTELEVGACVLHNYIAEVEALLLDIFTYVRQPRGEEQW